MALLRQQLDLQCLRDNSRSWAYGPRQWSCIHCRQQFSRGSGCWVGSKTQQHCARELRELQQLAGCACPPTAVRQSLPEIQRAIVRLRQRLKASNMASYCYCCTTCYLTHQLELDDLNLRFTQTQKLRNAYPWA